MLGALAKPLQPKFLAEIDTEVQNTCWEEDLEEADQSVRERFLPQQGGCTGSCFNSVTHLWLTQVLPMRVQHGLSVSLMSLLLFEHSNSRLICTFPVLVLELNMPFF